MTLLISLLVNVLLIAFLVLKYFRRQKLPRQKPRIMLVGMDQQTQHDLAAQLHKDYDLQFVDDSLLVAKLLRQATPDLIISEFLMPGISGEELCQTLRTDTRTSHIPVMFLTALSHRADIMHGLEAGAQDFMAKPYDIKTLKSRIAELIGDDGLGESDVVGSDNGQTAAAQALDLEFKAKLDDIIKDHLNDSELSIKDISMLLGMSRTATFTRIKSVTGHSPNDYLRLCRLTEGKMLLEARRWTIAEVAVKVGYNDPKYFSTSFKRHFGVSPSKI